MYGFQPRSARGKPAQHLADGGLVHSITGMLGMRKRTPEESLAADAKSQARNQEVAARVAAREQSVAAPASEPSKAISSYAGMTAMQRREKEAGLKDGGTVGGFKPGGLIRGPGTGTSDDIKTEKRPGTFIMPADSTQAITPEVLAKLGATEEMPEGAELGDDDQGEGGKVPVRLSNGEFDLPPEQVQALGAAVLTAMRDATHTPVESGKPTAKGFAPNQFFANGGTVFGSRGLAGLREVIPKVQAMGYPQAQQPAQAPAGSRDLAALKAMIPKMEAMGYPQALADGGMVENEVTRVGNSYSGGNVSGDVSINGQAGSGTVSTSSWTAPVVSTAPASAQAPAPAAPATAPVAAPAPAGAAAPAAPMGWAERNEQRNNAVTASSIMDSPERRAAQAALKPPPVPAPAPAPLAAPVGFQPAAQRTNTAPPPAPGLGFQPRRYANGGVVDDPQAKADRAKLGAAWDTVKDVNDDAGRAILDVATMVPRGLAGAYDSAVVRPMRAAGFNAGYLSQRLVPDGVDPSSMTPFTDQKRMAQSAPAMASASAGAGAGRGAVNPPAVNPSAPAPAAPAPTAVPGNAAVSSDGPRNGGQISDQNSAAADNLALGFRPGRRTPPPEQPGLGFAPAQVSAPVVRNSTNDWAARKALENAATSASSIGNTRRWGGKGAENNPAMQEYRAKLATDQALQQAQPGMDAAALRENGGLQREGIQQAGATARTGMQETGATQRAQGQLGVQQGELDMRRTAQGFQTRAAAQQEQLRNVLLDPNATPEQRKIAQRSLSALSGKTAADRMQAVNLPDTVSDQGVVMKGGQALVRTLEDGTVERVPIGGQQGQTSGKQAPANVTNDDAGKRLFASLPKGAEFVAPDGKTYRKG